MYLSGHERYIITLVIWGTFSIYRVTEFIVQRKEASELKKLRQEICEYVKKHR